MVGARVIVGFVFAALPAVAFAAGDKASPTDAPLSATKRELEALKNEHLVPNQTPKLDLPQAIEMPGLGTGNSAPLSEAKKKSLDPKAKGKTGNWLVDGVQKNGGRSTSDRPGLDQRPARDTSTRDDEAAFESDGGTAKSSGPELANRAARSVRSEDTKLQKSEPVDNPLSKYMGEWMSPRDYAILQKSEKAESAGNFAGSGMPAVSASANPVSTLPNSNGPLTIGGGDFQAIGFGAPTAGRENPYMQSLVAPTSPSPQLGGTSAFQSAIPTSQAARNNPSFTPAPLPEPKPSTFSAETQKRAEDAKYFPQLKRF